jgi:hypothetical protein
VVEQLHLVSEEAEPSVVAQAAALSHRLEMVSPLLSSHQLSAAQIGPLAPHLHSASFLTTPLVSAHLVTLPASEHVPAEVVVSQSCTVLHTVVESVPSHRHVLVVVDETPHKPSRAHLTPVLVSEVVDWQYSVDPQVTPPHAQLEPFTVTPVRSPHGAGVVQRVEELKLVLQ